MKWFHRVNADWYRARKNYLTASDIKSLWPKTKTGRDRKITDLDYMKIYFEKTQEVRFDDCDSFDWAARGHILEPYAIKEFNNQAIERYMYHWDDCIITKDGCCIAYSPDALDTLQDFNAVQVETDFVVPNIIGEVKCYNAAKHVETIMTPKSETEERLQIATAMCTSPSISDGYLILFNPEVEDVSLAWKHWTREELSNEINIVRDIEYSWRKFLDKISDKNDSQLNRYCDLGGSVVTGNLCMSMDEIIAEYMEKREEESRFNPPC